MTVTLGGATSAKRRKSVPAGLADPPPVYYGPLDGSMPEALARLQLPLPVGAAVRCSGPASGWAETAPSLAEPAPPPPN